MKLISEHKYLLIGIVIGAVLVFTLAKVTTERKLGELQLSLESSIQDSVASTTELIRIIGEGRLTRTAEAIISDCTAEERVLFENNLASLDRGLTTTELKLVDTLFSRCAPVQSIRRTLMVMDYDRQLDTLGTLIDQRKQVGEFNDHDEFVSNATTLLKHEERITELSLDLVYLQREIIDMLLRGGLVSSEEANALKERGYSLRTDLIREAEEASLVRARVLATP